MLCVNVMNKENPTKESFAKALMQCMTRKPLQDIRLQEICDACHCHRQTFYYYFHDKYELAYWTIFFFISNFMSGTILNHRDMALMIHEAVEENYSFWYHLYGDNSFETILLRMLDDGGGELLLSAIAQKGVSSSSEELRFAAKMFHSSMLIMVRSWVLEGCKEPAEILMEKIYRNAPQILQNYLV